MLRTVQVGTQRVDSYVTSVGDEVIRVLHEAAQPLRGARVLHMSATPYGGGVAELLRSEVPLLRDLGIDADWKIISGDDRFFSVTKAIHNSLQGSSVALSDEEWLEYFSHAQANAMQLDGDYDLVVVHDPQPLALAELAPGRSRRWIWRCHIDTSEPNSDVWDRLKQYVDAYDVAVFTLGGFVPPSFPIRYIAVIPPAIDPESPKNIGLGKHLARRVLHWIGVDLSRPLMTQVSRFDPWKDPLGVIEAYRIAKRVQPSLQLALVGAMALDDPEGWKVYDQIDEAARGDPDIRLFTNVTGVGNIEVNAFQRLSDVVVQKSIREGFGLVVSETLWKATPVVAGRAGGIPLQMQDGAGGFLVESIDECATHVLELLEDPDLANELARRGQELVRQRFLLPRLIADELRLYASMLDSHPPKHPDVAEAALTHELRDPVCGLRIDDPANAPTAFEGGDTYVFCSDRCRAEFLADSERFLRSQPRLATPSGATARGDDGSTVSTDG
jgi:trehalose synthase